MRYLLDTHVFLWLHGEPKRIPSRLARELARGTTELFLSVASAQEIVVKHALGKLTLPSAPREFVTSRCTEAGIALLPVTPDHVWALAALPPHHRDPFDRLLLALARCVGLTVVTADREFEKYDVRLEIV